MNSQQLGTVLNLYWIMKRHNRVLAATGSQRLANKAAWHTYGLIWLAGWAFIAPWIGFLIALGGAWGFAVIGATMLVVLIPAWFYAWHCDRKWETGLTATAMEPPPIPEQVYIAPAEPRTQQVLTAFYRPPQRRIRSPR